MPRTATCAVLVVLSLTSHTQAGRQAPATPAPDVVSIRPSAPSDGIDAILSSGVRPLGDRLRATNSSVQQMVHAAYESEFAYPDQIVAEGWIRAERFDVDIIAAAPLGAPAEGRRLSRDAATLLQRVLQDRFQLRTRRETREFSRLVLTYARADRQLKPGIRSSDQNCAGLTPSTHPQCVYRPLAGQFSMRGRPLQEFTSYLSRPAYAGGLVIDATGMTGPVDIDFEWSLDWSDLLRSQGNLMTALQEQLGLKMETRRIATPVLIIEQATRPSAN